MNLLNYMMSIKHLIGDFNIDENHKTKILTIRSAKALTDEQKREVVKLSPLPGIEYVVKGSL